MGTLRKLFSYILLFAGVVVGINMILDSFYSEIAGQIWGYVDWLMALALLIALVAGTRRIVLAGSGDFRAKFELLATVFVSLLYFHTWFNFMNEVTIADDTWMVIDALFVVVTLSVGMRLLRMDQETTPESDS